MTLDRKAWPVNGEATSLPSNQTEANQSGWKRHHVLFAGVALVAFTGLTLRYGAAAWTLVQDEVALEAFIAGLGWFGPLALVLFNALQIVIAPVPGYVMQFAAGYLFGPFWGGVWGSLGLMLGAALAMGLARYFGRPLAERMVGADRLDRWEGVTHSDSVLLWFVLIIAPTGDLPYFLAGLSSVRFSTVLLLTLAIRVPTTFVVAAAGGGVMLLSQIQLIIAVIGLTALLLVFMRYQDRLVTRIDRQVHRKLAYTTTATGPIASGPIVPSPIVPSPASAVEADE